MVRKGLSTVAVVTLLLATSASIVTSAEPIASEAPANPAFQRTWDRTDNPVANGQIPGGRTWMWGPQANTGPLQEEYAQSPGQMRTVQYFDKSRMEITQPGADQNTIWYVTNGLLVIELVTGRLKTGDLDHEYVQYPPAMVNVAGDPDDAGGPTYATFESLMSVHAGASVAAVVQVLDRQGNITTDQSKAAYAIPTVHYVSDTNHWVAEPFWNFMTASGIVYQDGAYVTEQLFDNPYYATGFPISEPYWSTIKVGGVYTDVLMQCFERRCLTYTPSNEPAWRVEMGNVGQHYYTWRYEDIVVIPPVIVDPCPETVSGTYVWVADTVNDRVQKFTSTGSYLCDLNPANTGLVVGEPWAIAVDPRNNDLIVHVDDWMHRFDYRGNWVDAFGGMERYYEDIAIDSDGNIYGIDEVNSRISKYSPSGALLMDWGSHGSNEADFELPTGIDVDADGNIYVVDRINQRVSMFFPNGAFSHMWGSGDILYFPDAVAVDGAGYTYVTDISIFVFDPNGALIDTWESTSEWTASYGIAIGANSNFYALDRINSSVNYFNSSGTRLGGWGTYGDEPGNFDSANGIATATR